MSIDIFGVGVLVFNPFDDKNHLERIQNCIESIVQSIEHSKEKIKLIILMNESYVKIPGTTTKKQLTGVGEKTKIILTKFYESYDFIELHSISYTNSMNVKGYAYLLKYIYSNTASKYLSIFADDYIMPKNWIKIVLNEFDEQENLDFLMPATSYVTHKNLLIPFDEKPTWDQDIRDGIKVGIRRGVRIDDINEISNKLQNFRSIKYVPSASFETTVFTRDCIKKHGFIYEEYFSVFWNTEYFHNLQKNGAKGLISRKAFVFHYGKGGTTALYEKTGDEKFEGSPVEKNLISDVKLYNKRNNQNIGYWWRNEISIPSNYSKEYILKLVEEYDQNDKKNILKKIYLKLRKMVRL